MAIFGRSDRTAKKGRRSPSITGYDASLRFEEDEAHPFISFFLPSDWGERGGVNHYFQTRCMAESLRQQYSNPLILLTVPT